MAASDINLKENISKVGEENGFNIYEFNYKGQIVSICVYYDDKYPNGYKECEFYGIKMENLLIKDKEIRKK